MLTTIAEAVRLALAVTGIIVVVITFSLWLAIEVARWLL